MRLVLLLCLLANPDGDCTKSGDCERGSYCKAGTCVPKGEDNGRLADEAAHQPVRTVGEADCVH